MSGVRTRVLKNTIFPLLQKSPEFRMPFAGVVQELSLKPQKRSKKNESRECPVCSKSESVPIIIVYPTYMIPMYGDLDLGSWFSTPLWVVESSPFSVLCYLLFDLPPLPRNGLMAQTIFDHCARNNGRLHTRRKPNPAPRRSVIHVPTAAVVGRHRQSSPPLPSFHPLYPGSFLRPHRWPRTPPWARR